MRTLFLPLLLISLFSCSKSGGSNTPVSFKYVDNQTTDTVSTSVQNAYIQSQFDPISGQNSYVFHLDGPSNSTLHFTVQVPSLTTGAYIASGYSSAYPGPLDYDVWEYKDHSVLVPDTAYVELTITSTGTTTASGQFNFNFRAGAEFATIKEATFSNLSIKSK
jgi:hypothetical protein